MVGSARRVINSSVGIDPPAASSCKGRDSLRFCQAKWGAAAVRAARATGCSRRSRRARGFHPWTSRRRAGRPTRQVLLPSSRNAGTVQDLERDAVFSENVQEQLVKTGEHRICPQDG